MDKKEFDAEKFLKGFHSYTDTCVSCKFFIPSKSKCIKKETEVFSKTPKCEEWRYFT